jgi:hypothetical protein
MWIRWIRIRIQIRIRNTGSSTWSVAGRHEAGAEQPPVHLRGFRLRQVSQCFQGIKYG